MNRSMLTGPDGSVRGVVLADGQRIEPAGTWPWWPGTAKPERPATGS